MQIVKQLALFLENKPGTLANLCRALSDAEINILALSVADAVDHAVVRIVVDDTQKTLHLLGEHGVMAVERDVLMLKADNKPGVLAEIADKLAEKKVNIEYAYCASLPGVKHGVVILRVDDPKKAKRVLAGR